MLLQIFSMFFKPSKKRVKRDSVKEVALFTSGLDRKNARKKLPQYQYRKLKKKGII